MPELVHCIYTSVQTAILSPAEIDMLIAQSQNSNRHHAITGVLLHVGTTFFQVLEGPPAAIDALYRKILTDARHTKVTRIIYEAISRRFFADSTMNLATLSPGELAAALDEADADRMELLLAGLDEGRAKRLLRAFSQGRWRARCAMPVVEGQVTA